MAPRRRSPRPSQDEPDPNLDRPPLGPDGERPAPLESETPEIARRYDPGFTPPADDDDPWQDEGHPEASG